MILWITAMLVLMVGSALFSGSEAALFSLRPRDRRGLKRTGLAGRVAGKLLDHPERLLSAILFWNLLINMLYFAIAAIVGSRLESGGGSYAVLFTIVSLLMIIFFSEMLPKSLAVLAPVRISLWVAVPMSIAVRIVGPILPLVTVTNLAASRLLWPNFEPEPEIELSDIERAIDLGTDDAALISRERVALRSLVEIAGTTVSEWMSPRSRLETIEVGAADAGPDRQGVLDSIGGGEPKAIPDHLMLLDADGESIVASVAARGMRPSQLDDPSASAESVIYVPWSATVANVLDRLSVEDRSVAVVVNEFGECVGAISMEEILRRVFDPESEQHLFSDTQFDETTEGILRVFGGASIRSLCRRLDTEPPEDGVTTVAGFIQRTNSRLPRVGDQADVGVFNLVVDEETDRGIWVSVRPLDQPDASEPASW